MASVSKLPNGKYRVQWRDFEKRKRSKQFDTKSEARKFAAVLELSPQERITRITFATVLEEYRDRITSRKKGFRPETLRINRLLKREFTHLPIAQITTREIQNYIDLRMMEPSPTGGLISSASVLKETILLSSVFNYAIRQGLIKENPVKGAVRPKENEHRERVASEEDIEKLLIASGWDGESAPETSTQLVMLAFLFACRTGMRSGEILKLERSWIDGCVIHLPKEATKTNSKRDVALSHDALRLLGLAIEATDSKHPRIFYVLTDERRDALWRKIRDRAGLGAVTDSMGRKIKEGLNFHDSRATFATWAASPDPRTGAPRLDILALARQTGHKNLTTLRRYYRATAEEIAKRLD